MKTKYFISGVLIILLLSLGVSLALAESENQVYYACINNASGTIKMVSEDESCQTNEMLIQWNQVGPPGPQGIQGEPGPIGPPGPAGAGLSSIEWFIQEEELPADSPTMYSYSFECPSGKVLLSGGYLLLSPKEGVTIFGAYPYVAGGLQQYTVYATNSSDTVGHLHIYALCATLE